MKTKKVYTHHDIAKQVGVSQSTVSRALDPAQRHLISPEVVEQIQRVAEKVGFKSNILARRLRNQRSETITLVIPHRIFRPPKYIDFEAGNALLMWNEIQGVIHEATARNYDIKLVPQHGGDPILREYLLGHVGYPHSDGVIFSSLGTADDTADELIRRGLPVLATGTYANQLPLPLIAIDQAPGIVAAIEQLIADGHRRIAYFAFAPDFSTNEGWLPRYRAVTGTLERADIFDPALVYCTQSEAALRALVRELPVQPPFTAAFCSNDNQAARLMHELVEHGRRVPGDVAVVGFDNNPLYHQGERALSSVDLPVYGVGRLAATRLIDLIEGKHKPKAVEVIPTSYIPRKTT